MERFAPSFQTFLKKTAPLEHDSTNPLPPPPATFRRASSNSLRRSRSRSRSSSARRSSSVYSRTISTWKPNELYLKADTYKNEPLPRLPLLQPLRYSASTPHLVERQSTPPLLHPRTYKPLIATPSSSISRGATPSPRRPRKESALLPSPPQFVQLPKKHLRIISLEKAKAAVGAPGAVHLLPEELREQATARSGSHEPRRAASIEILGTSPPELPRPPIWRDSLGRYRALQSPTNFSVGGPRCPPPLSHTETKDFANPYTLTNVPYDYALPSNRMEQSVSTASIELPVEDSDDARGRTLTRGRGRTPPGGHNFPRDKFAAPSHSSESRSLFSASYRLPSSSPAWHSSDSDSNVKMQMKLIPKPLFQNKPPAKFPGDVRRRGSDNHSSVSPSGLSPLGTRSNFDRSYSPRSGSPLQVDVPSSSSHRRTSTSGSIPISPPTFKSTRFAMPSVAERVHEPQSSKTKPKRAAKTSRASAFYPHVATRKGTRTRTKGRAAPPMPKLLLSADIIAQRLGNAESLFSPTIAESLIPPVEAPEPRRKSDGSSFKSRRGLQQRLARYADKLTRPSHSTFPRHHDRPADLETTADDHFPHFDPSPAITSSKEVHLGWTRSSKIAFDAAHSPTTPSHRPDWASPPPVRPSLDASPRLNSQDSDLPRRKSSMIAHFLDSWRDNKAEKRREELKKIIKVVPVENVKVAQMQTPMIVASGSVTGSGGMGQNPRAKARRTSSFGWM